MGELLTLPIFARIDEYAGAWLIDADILSAYFAAIKIEGIKAHFAAQSEPLAVVEKQEASGKKISIIHLNGLLMKGRSSMGGTSTIEARREIRNAANDPDTDAILLAIDSPGGTVAGTWELADDIRAAGKAKPVWSHVSGLGASAAYWAASQTARITANSPTDQIGSIGTVQVIYDRSGEAEQQGIKVLRFATGPLKGLGIPGTKVTDEQAAHVQQIIDSVQVYFDSAVRKGRNLTAAELNAVRHGGVFTATEAVNAKLIDGIQPLSKSINDLARSLSSGGKQRAELVAALPMIQHGGLPLLVPGDAQ